MKRNVWQETGEAPLVQQRGQGRKTQGKSTESGEEGVQGVGAETCKPMMTVETRVSPLDTCEGLSVEYEKAELAHITT